MTCESGTASSESGRRYLEAVYGHDTLLESGDPICKSTASEVVEPRISRESGRRI